MRTSFLIVLLFIICITNASGQTESLLINRSPLNLPFKVSNPDSLIKLDSIVFDIGYNLEFLSYLSFYSDSTLQLRSIKSSHFATLPSKTDITIDSTVTTTELYINDGKWFFDEKNSIITLFFHNQDSKIKDIKPATYKVFIDNKQQVIFTKQSCK